MPNLDKKVISAVILAFIFQLIFPQYSHAYGLNAAQISAASNPLLVANSPQPILYNGEKLAEIYDLPESEERKPVRTVTVSMTAYSSTVDQTDDSPFITANGTRVRDGIVAANFVPFGTKVKIPELYGDKVFEVTDRMNKRYQTRVDIWMETRQEAIQFGVKRNVTIEIY